MTVSQVHLPSELQKRAARAGWQLTATRTGSYMLRKGIYSRHFGELCDVAQAFGAAAQAVEAETVYADGQFTFV